MNYGKFFLLFMFLFVLTTPNQKAQIFTRITDITNPIVSDSFPRGYIGASWIDYNNDGLQDLFVNNDYLYKNEGNGSFSKNLVFKGQTASLNPPTVVGSGNSWADYDNDGDPDMFSASAKSFLFRNDGNETFTRISSGSISDSIGNRGWTCAWADYDNDGYVDLLIVHPANFVPGVPIPNHLYHNDGPPNYTFTNVTGFEFTDKTAPYTVATWSDYDLDGDMDLFIGSGPANGTPARDFLYKNMLKETGKATFTRINTSPIGTDLQDGQVWNWIDYDNDGDLDAFLTNYGSAPNRFYKNNNGNFSQITTGMELNGKGSLASTWGDFDNDGFPDVIITTEAKTYFYHNNGDGTFKSVSNGITLTDKERGASIGDYNNDGNLDVYIAGFPGARGLFRNDNNNGNNWKKFKLTGTASNKSAIGALIRLKATIKGVPMWQMREVSAQNSFNGQNSLDVHFGLGDASVIDSVIVSWPSGIKQVLINVPINTMENIIESSATGIKEINELPGSFVLDQNFPNPFNPTTTISYQIKTTSFVSLKIYDVLGNELSTLVNEEKPAGIYKVEFSAQGKPASGGNTFFLPSGIYIYKLQAGAFTGEKKMLLLK